VRTSRKEEKFFLPKDSSFIIRVIDMLRIEKAQLFALILLNSFSVEHEYVINFGRERVRSEKKITQ
jgi:hypothetical protein